MATTTPLLDDRVANGTERSSVGVPAINPRISCADGFSLSVIAPDPADAALLPAEELEVGFPSERPEPWGRWRHHLDIGIPEHADPTQATYPAVPVALVRELIEAHGGELLPRLPRQRA